MSVTREERLPSGQSARTRPSFGAVALVAFVAASATAAILTWDGDDSREYAQAVQAPVTQHIQELDYIGGPDAGGYLQPADAAVQHGIRYVLDTGNNRILAIEQAGPVSAIIAPQEEVGSLLNGAMAIASDGDVLYIANTGAGNVLVMRPDGILVRTIDLSQAPPTGKDPRPAGVAVDGEGNLAVSDVAGNRVLRYDANGSLVQEMGTGSRAGGTEGFNAPGGLTFDTAGNLYVVDILNARVVKVAPDGRFIAEFGRPGDTSATLSRPKDVAVDGAGNVYVSDGLLAAVQVFAPDGGYRGFIGREDPANAGSKSVFTAPAGLAIDGERLTVIDRFGGLFEFGLTGPE
jgi:sugar lactone lactonase YvrE